MIQMRAMRAIGKKPRRSALRWLDLRVPFTEVVGPVLKAAQAGSPASNMDLPLANDHSRLSKLQYAYPILQEGAFVLLIQAHAQSQLLLYEVQFCRFKTCSRCKCCRIGKVV